MVSESQTTIPNPTLYVYRAVVNRVIDGDTIDVTIDLGFNITSTHRVRLLGVDTPEIFHPKDSAERELGLQAKAFLENAVAEKTILIRTVLDKTDKYGRILGYIWIPGEPTTINEQLLSNGFVKTSSPVG